MSRYPHSQNQQRMKDRSDAIRERAREMLKGNGFGLTSDRLVDVIPEAASPSEIAAALRRDDGIENVGTGNHAAWMLRDRPQEKAQQGVKK